MTRRTSHRNDRGHVAVMAMFAVGPAMIASYVIVSVAYGNTTVYDGGAATPVMLALIGASVAYGIAGGLSYLHVAATCGRCQVDVPEEPEQLLMIQRLAMSWTHRRRGIAAAIDARFGTLGMYVSAGIVATAVVLLVVYAGPFAALALLILHGEAMALHQHDRLSRLCSACPSRT